MVNDKGMLYGKWGKDLPELQRRNADLDKRDNLSWANESPYIVGGNFGEGELVNPYVPFESQTRVSSFDPRRTPSKDLPKEYQVSVASGMKSALDHQVGNSNHYKDTEIQPIEFITKNDLSFIVGNCIKYVVRAKKKGGAEDIKKAMHYLQLELELKYGIRSEVKYQE